MHQEIWVRVQEGTRKERRWEPEHRYCWSIWQRVGGRTGLDKKTVVNCGSQGSEEMVAAPSGVPTNRERCLHETHVYVCFCCRTTPSVLRCTALALSLLLQSRHYPGEPVKPPIFHLHPIIIAKSVIKEKNLNQSFSPDFLCGHFLKQMKMLL